MSNAVVGVYAFKPNQEYKVAHISEGFFGVLFLGAASLNPKRLEAIFTEKRRKCFFWNVDSANY